MADDKLGKQLYDSGWHQGVLLPALPWSVIYHLDDPINKIAKTAAKHLGTADNKQKIALAATDAHGIGIASGITRKEDYLVIASQDCDIVKKLSEEPNIVTMRAFVTDNKKILEWADGNSPRYFLLDHHRNLVAEASILVLLEKPVLMNFTPERGALDDDRTQRFARWVAHRFDRPAFDDKIVAAVTGPILNNLVEMSKVNDPDLRALDMIKEVRLAKIEGGPPYDVRLIFIIPESGLPDKGIALAHLVSRIRGWFNPLAARLVAWEIRHIYEISVGDYLDTQQIYLEHYTYQGQTIQGLPPPSGI